MILIANGCSHTYGMELPEDQRLDNCFAGLIAKELGMEFVNLAIPGASNDRIFRTSVEYIVDHKEESFWLIGWTERSRHEWYFAPYQEHIGLAHWSMFDERPTQMFRATVQMILHEAYYTKGWYSDNQSDWLKWSTHIHNLQAVFKLRNIPFFMFDTLDSRDTDGFLSIECPEYPSLSADLWGNYFYGEHNRSNICENGHPNKAGHRLWADILMAHIRKVHLQL